MNDRDKPYCKGPRRRRAETSLPVSEGVGGVAEGRLTIPDRAGRACMSLVDRERAGMPVQSNRRVTKLTTD